MLKILSLNINYYGNKHGDWADRKNIIIDLIKETEADIIALQAVCSDLRIENGKNQAAQLSEQLPGFPYHIFSSVNRNKNGGQEGNAILSRYAIKNAETILLELKAGAEDPAQRLLQYASIDVNRSPINLINAHFSWVKEQTDQNVKDALPAVKGLDGKCLMVGDMNTDPKDKVLTPFKEAGFTDLWEKLNPGNEGFTFESDKPFTRIDYAWANKALESHVTGIKTVSKEKTGKVRLSDHLGVLIEILI